MPLNAIQTDAALTAIELAWQLEPGTEAAPEQAGILAGFTGWGGLAPAFDQNPAGRWADAFDRIVDALPVPALRSAREQCDNSFFTPRPLVDAIYGLLRGVGFTGGRILEPGCGHGTFMAAAPADWDIEWTGVEIDPTSARIATLRKPAARVIPESLQKTALRQGGFDAVIGNVPFSSSRVYDAEGRGGALHTYFLRRALDAVRDGGYVALLTSRYALDGGDIADLMQHYRTEAATGEKGAQFIGAVRLPTGAFAEAGTEVVSDLVLFRGGLQNPQHAYDFDPDTIKVERPNTSYYGPRTMIVSEDARVPVTEPDKPGITGVGTPVSRYWSQRPSHVAGTMKVTSFAQNPLVVRSPNPEMDIRRAIAALAAEAPAYSEPRSVIDDLSDVQLADAEGRKEGSFHLIDGTLHRVLNGKLEPIRASKELNALVELRDLALQLLSLEADTALPDAAIATVRGQAHDAYQSYVRRFGPLGRGTLVEGRVDEETGLPALSWRRPAMGGFRKDPDSAIVMALEAFDQDTAEHAPAPILLRRVNRRPAPATHANTPAEALAISLGENGQVDLDRIAGLLSMDAMAAREALGTLVFDDPGTPRLVSAAEYLSGDVRRKLQEARDADATANVAALEAVQPIELGPLDISIHLGSPFVRLSDVADFMREELGVPYPRVTVEPEQRTWEVEETNGSADARMRFGTPDTLLSYLLECALNGRMPEVRDRRWGENGQPVYVRNVQKTAAAAEKLALLADHFSTWVWQDETRASRICREYNEQLNGHVVRRYDGSGLTFPGLSAEVTPWRHQRAAVERIVSTERAMIAHAVGSGKTLTMVLAARTLRQFGLASKPLVVVPNHLLDQISREAQQAFPTASFLIATKDDLAKDARRLFAARCATGDWDAVIMTHSAFTSIPVHPATEQAWLEDQKDDLVDAIYRHGNSRSKGAKAIARSVRALDQRLGKLRDGIGDTDAIWFDQLGIDYLMIDEAHLFRRLDTQTKERGSGLGSGSSKRATDLLLKVEALAARKGAGAPVCAFFTGTPWSNTLAETWVWQRYLQPDTLRRIGLLNFDAWVSSFIRYENAIEVAPDGSGFRMQRRPVGLINFPEVKTLLAQVADILDPDEIAAERPTRETRTIVVPPTPGQRAFVQGLADRADAIKSGTKATVAGANGDVDDSMLLVCNDGRKVALDPKLVHIDEESGKIAKLASEIAAVHHENADRVFDGAGPRPGAFQMVFLDLGTPKPHDSATYGRLRRHLVDRGIPAGQIRFVHEATTDKARAALFAACRDGDVSVLIGSTAKVGMGTNIQSRLTDLWHADAPWLPSDVTQRNGRGDRPKNYAKHLRITRMVTEGTFDAYTWQALERKSRSFDALYATGASPREIEDVSAATIDYGQIKAVASGNPLLLEQAKARAVVKRLQLLRSVHLQSVRKAQQAADELTTRARTRREWADRLDAAAAALTPTASDADSQTIMDMAADMVDRKDHIWRRTWRGLHISASAPDDRNERRVSAGLAYETVIEFIVPRKIIRQGVHSVAKFVTDQLDGAVGRLADGAATARLEAVKCDELAAENLTSAETAVFDQQAELDEATMQLARIDLDIAADAEKRPEPLELAA